MGSHIILMLTGDMTSFKVQALTRSKQSRRCDTFLLIDVFSLVGNPLGTVQQPNGSVSVI